MGESAARVQASGSRDDRPAVDRHIWLVADDYGISPAVSAAIRDLLVRGRLSATSVMMTSPGCSDDDVRSLVALRDAGKPIAIGLHVTLTGPFRPLTPGFSPSRDGAFLPLAPLMARALLGRLDPAPFATEIAAQLAAFAAAFGRPFIDYFIALKEFEIDRFLADVTDWEQREYLALL